MTNSTQCRTKRLPDLLALNTALQSSADTAVTARGSEWVLLTQSSGGGHALFIGTPNVVAFHYLAQRYESITFWSVAPHSRSAWQKIANFLDNPPDTELLPVADVYVRLSGKRAYYKLIAIDGTVGRLLGIVPDRSTPLFELVKNALTSDGQCCVVTGIDPTLAGIRRLRTEKEFLSLRQLRSAMSPLPEQRAYFQYPNHVRPQEILGWSSSLPQPIRSPLTRSLDKIGLIAPLHNSTAILCGLQTYKPMLVAIADEAYRAAGMHGQPVIDRCLTRDNGTVTVMLSAGETESSVLRIPLSRAADTRLRHAWCGLRELQAELPWLRDVTPESLSRGELLGMPYYLEGRCNGITASVLGRKPKHRAAVCEKILDFLIKFGLADNEPVSMNSNLLNQCIEGCFEPIRQYSLAATPLLDMLFDKINEIVHRHNLTLVHVHGDFNPSNVLCSPTNGSICGVIDWDGCQSRGLPMQDIIHFFIDQQRNNQPMSMGDAIVKAISGDLFSKNKLESKLLSHYRTVFDIDDELNNSLLVLYWLRHICLHIVYRNGPLPDNWLRANLFRPLSDVVSLYA